MIESKKKKAKTEPTDLVTTSFQLPEGLRTEFKIRCLERRIREREVIQTAIEAFVKNSQLIEATRDGMDEVERKIHNMVDHAIRDLAWRKVLLNLLERIIQQMDSPVQTHNNRKWIA